MFTKHKSGKMLFLLGLIVGIVLFGVGRAGTASALSAGDWQAGNIISDTIFFNPSVMNPNQIQLFLNAKVPNCDTNGSKIYSGSTTRAQYGASKGYPAPYTCLKNYSQDTPSMAAETGLCGAYSGGTKSSAQLIYDVAQACRVNPEILLTLLQKEQGLVTDDWPWSNQYQSATGFGCPDTAPCDPSYGGFFYQVFNAARQFRVYQKNASSFSYRAGRNSNILYNPNAACSSSSVYVQNQATAGLYAYTPYQPNAAALANMNGLGDSCSSYGNRNFWRMFTDWFGPTVDGDSYFTLTNVNPDNGANAWYLVTPKGKYYIPSVDVYNAWGFNNYAFQQVTQSYFDSVPDGGTLGRALKDEYGNYFFVDNGQTHYVRSPSYLNLYGASTASAVQSTGLVYALPGGDWAGRFAKDIATGDLWLMDGGKKHAVPSNSPMAYHWRFTADQQTRVSSTYLSSAVDGGPLTQFVSSGGGTFVVDSGTIDYFDNGNVQNAYANQTPLTISDLNTLSYFPLRKASVFAEDTTSRSWYMLEGGRKHYIPNAQIASDWGYKPGQSLTSLSTSYLNSFTDGGTLSYFVQQPSSQQWIVDGSKHYIPTGNVSAAWIPSGTTIPTYSAQSLELLSRGTDATTFVQPQGMPYVYSLDNGTKRYLPLAIVQNAWGIAATSTVNMSPSLTNLVPEASPVSVIVQNSGTYYLLVNGTAYPINTTYASSWRTNGSVPTIANTTLARFTVSTQQVGANIKVDNKYYIINDLYATPVATYNDAYNISGANAVTLPYNYFSTTAQASYLVKSTDTADTRMWLVNQGQKIAFSSFAQQANYGYISQGTPVTALSPAILAAIPDSTSTPSLLVTKTGAGVKLLSFGSALGFPDGPTLTGYISATNPILTLSPSIYDQFTLRRSASLVVRDDNGNVYHIENGAKRLVQSGALPHTTFASTPQSYLEGTTMASLPNGAPIN